MRTAGRLPARSRLRDAAILPGPGCVTRCDGRLLDVLEFQNINGLSESALNDCLHHVLLIEWLLRPDPSSLTPAGVG